MPTDLFRIGQASAGQYLGTEAAAEEFKAVQAELDAQKEREQQERKNRLLELDANQQFIDSYRLDKDAINTVADSAYQQNLITNSGMIADKAADIRRKVAKGELDPTEAQQGLNALNGSIEAMNASIETANQQAMLFDDVVENGSLSKATSADALAFSKGLKEQSIRPVFNPEDNQMYYQGVDAEGNDINIPASQLSQRVPGIIKEVDHPSSLIKETLQGISKVKREQAAGEGLVYQGDIWDDEVEEAVLANLDPLVKDPNSLLSLAVDHLGISNIQAQKLAREEDKENGGNMLQDLVEEKLVDLAESFHIESKLKRKEPLSLEEELSLRSRQQVKTQAQLNELGGTKRTDFDKRQEAEQFRIEQDKQLLKNALTPVDGELPNLAGLIGKGNIQNVEYDSNWGEGGEMEITLKGQDKPLKFPVDAQGNLSPDAKQLLFTQLELGTIGNDKLSADDLLAKYGAGSPVKKNSPLKNTKEGGIQPAQVSTADYLKIGQAYGQFKLGDDKAREYSWLNQGDDFIDPQTGERYRYDFLMEEGGDEKSLEIGKRVREAQAKANAKANEAYNQFRTSQDETWGAFSDSEKRARSIKAAKAIKGLKLAESDDFKKLIGDFDTHGAGVGGFDDNQLRQVRDYLERNIGSGKERSKVTGILQSLYN